MTFWSWVLYLGDGLRMLALGIGMWIRGYHFHFYACRMVSVFGGSWLNSGMGGVDFYCCSPFFVTQPARSFDIRLGEGGISMAIEDDIGGDELMPPTPTQILASAVDAELADLFGWDAHEIREDHDLSASDGRIGMGTLLSDSGMWSQ